MKFCPECNSLLYFIEEENILYISCRTCGYKDQTDEKLIEKNIYKNVHHMNIENISYFRYDNTLSRTIHKKCPNEDCLSHKDTKLQEAVFYNDPDSMKLVYICVVCNTEWKYA